MIELADGCVLHGWGQQIAYYQKEALPYIAACGAEPAIISDYADLGLVHGATPQVIAWARQQHSQVVGEMDDEALAKLIDKLSVTPAKFMRFRRQQGKDYMLLLGVSWFRFTDEAVAGGAMDAAIELLADEAKSCDGPVMLRPGYEFGPHGITGQKGQTTREHYASMFRHFVDIFRRRGATNVAFVWNTVGVEAYDYWMDYYPGDDYVDWWGVNLFSTNQIAGCGPFLAAARDHGKRVIICESAPAFAGGTTDPNVIERFFTPYFDLLAEHDHIQAFVYINVDWASQEGSLFTSWPDSRIQSSPQVQSFYRDAIRGERFVHLRQT